MDASDHAAAALAARLMGRVPDQVAFVTHDLEGAAQFLDRAFGLGPWDGYEYTASYLPKRIFRGMPGTFTSRSIGCRAQPHVEVIQPLEGPSIFLEHLDRHGPGLHHVAYFIESLEAVRKHMTSLGFVEVQSGGGHGVDGDGEFAFFEISRSCWVVRGVRPATAAALPTPLHAAVRNDGGPMNSAALPAWSASRPH